MERNRLDPYPWDTIEERRRALKYIGKRKLETILNPHAKPTRKWDRERLWILWFCQYGPLYVGVYADSLETALEEAAQYCAEKGYNGLVMDYEAARDACDCDPWECEDLTYTESGWIGSDDWGIALENPSRKTLVRWHRGD